MKSLIASVIIVCAVVIFTAAGSVFVSESLDAVCSHAADIDIDKDSYEGIYEKAVAAEDELKRRECLFDLLLDDDDEQAIHFSIEDIKSAAMAKSDEGILTAKNRLISEIEKMRRLCSFSIEAIF